MDLKLISAKRLKPFVSILLPDLRGGGAERITVNLVNELVSRGFNVDLVLLSATGPFLENLDSNVHVVDLKVQRMRSVLLSLMRYLRMAKPDALLACMWPLTIISVLAQRLSYVGTRLVVAEHNTWSLSQAEYSGLQQFIIKITMQILFPFADAIVAVSDGAADDLAKFSRVDLKKISTIYNPVTDSSLIESKCDNQLSSSTHGWNSAAFRILNVGTLKDQKNQELLIRAFSKLPAEIGAHLLILGDGELRDKLELLIVELGIQGHVSMPGFISDPGPYYRHASLFALSSDWEGLPTVIIEALAVGTPVVSTDCPSGPREILCNGQFGRLVPVGDTAAFATAMAESLSTTHDRDALKARSRDFSIDKAVDKYVALFYPDRRLDARS